MSLDIYASGEFDVTHLIDPQSNYLSSNMAAYSLRDFTGLDAGQSFTIASVDTKGLALSSNMSILSDFDLTYMPHLTSGLRIEQKVDSNMKAHPPSLMLLLILGMVCVIFSSIYRFQKFRNILSDNKV